MNICQHFLCDAQATSRIYVSDTQGPTATNSTTGKGIYCHRHAAYRAELLVPAWTDRVVAKEAAARQSHAIWLANYNAARSI